MINLNLLICPGPCSAPLLSVGDFYKCSNINCYHNAEVNWFFKINNVPVLISEINCDTVFSASLIRKNNENPFVKRRLKYNFFPFLKNRGSGTREIAQQLVSDLKVSGKSIKNILIIGSGSPGLSTELLWSSKNISITGIDIFYSNTVDFIADAHYLPFASSSFDAVWIQAVLEHVVDPVKVVSEIHRVLVDDGVVYAESPFLQQVHEGAYDFNRFTVLGHRYLFKDFNLISMGGREAFGLPLAWTIKYMFWGIFRNKGIARILAAPFFILLRSIDLLASKKILFDSSSIVFFLGRKSKFSIKHKDLLRLYNGLQ